MPEETLSAHKKIMHLMQRFNHKVDLAGVCQGISWVWIAGYMQLAIEQQTAEKTEIDRLIKIMVDLYDNDITGKEQIIQRYDQQTWVNVLAVMDSIAFYQRLFNAQEPFRGDNVQGSMDDSIVATDFVEKEGGFVKAKVVTCPYEYQDLKNILTSFENVIDNNQDIEVPVVLHLSSQDHSIALLYHGQKKQWQFFDVNQIEKPYNEIKPTKKPSSVESLVDFIANAFIGRPQSGLYGEHIVFSINVMTTNNYLLKANEIIDSWQRDQKFINAYKKQNTEHGYYEPDEAGSRLLDVVIKNGDVDRLVDMYENGFDFDKAREKGSEFNIDKLSNIIIDEMPDKVSTLIRVHVDYMLAHNEDPNAPGGIFQNSPLKLAVKFNDYATADYILDNGGTVGIEEGLYQAAIENRNSEMIEYLLAKRVDPSKDTRQISALCHIAEQWPERLDWFLSRLDDPARHDLGVELVAHDLVTDNDLDILDKLIRYRVLKQKHLVNPLNVAIKKNNENAVRYFLAKQADPNGYAYLGSMKEFPLSNARFSNVGLNIIKLLRDKGAQFPGQKANHRKFVDIVNKLDELQQADTCHDLYRQTLKMLKKAVRAAFKDQSPKQYFDNCDRLLKQTGVSFDHSAGSNLGMMSKLKSSLARFNLFNANVSSNSKDKPDPSSNSPSKDKPE